MSVIDRIRRTLRPGGLFLGHFNSTEDAHFGAVGNVQLESDLFIVSDGGLGNPSSPIENADDACH